MANKRINDLQARSDFDATCNIAVDDASQTWRATGAQLLDYINANAEPADISAAAIHGQTEDTTPVDADEVVTWDASATAIKKSTRANFLKETPSTVTTTYSVLDGDTTVLADATGGAFTIGAAAASTGTTRIRRITKIDSSTNAVTISATISGVANRKLAAAGDYIEYISDGTNYHLLANKTTSEVIVDGGAGHGSTGTMIRRLANTRKSVGSAIVYADSATAGASFTILEDGIYSMHYSDSGGAAVSLGISLNASSLTANLTGMTYAQGLRANVETSQSGFYGNAIATLALVAGDVIRPHTDAAPTANTARVRFAITKVG